MPLPNFDGGTSKWVVVSPPHRSPRHSPAPKPCVSPLRVDPHLRSFHQSLPKLPRQPLLSPGPPNKKTPPQSTIQKNLFLRRLSASAANSWNRFSRALPIPSSSL